MKTKPQSTWIKICGITMSEDALYAGQLGADAIGFNFFSGSKRYIEPHKVEKIIKVLPEGVLKVGVFVNESIDRVKEIQQQCQLDLLQFHGDEPPSFCKQFQGEFLKAIRIDHSIDFDAVKSYTDLQSSPRRFLLDHRVAGTYGGTGSSFDWHLAVKAKSLGQVILSGGLKPDNVRQALELVTPYGVDVSSGVEENPTLRPGVKDRLKMKQFIEAVKQWDLENNQNE